MISWEPYEVISYSQKVMGRWGSIINIKAKNLLNWSIITKTFSDNDRFEIADIVTKSYDYLYNDGGETYYFMNRDSYEQVELWKSVLWDDVLFLNDGDKVMLQEFKWSPISISLEPSVVMKVLDTPPGEKWDTATWWKKPATLSSWLVVQVPLFINIWDNIKVDTRTKQYLSRS